MNKELNGLIEKAITHEIGLCSFADLFEDTLIKIENHNQQPDQIYYDLCHDAALFDNEGTGDPNLLNDRAFMEAIKNAYLDLSTKYGL